MPTTPKIEKSVEQREQSRLPLLVGGVVGVLTLLAACSTPGDPARSEDPIQGDLPSSTISGAANNVDDGTEAGIDLDNGNVPGSTNDEDLDEYTDDIDIDAIADDPEMEDGGN